MTTPPPGAVRSMGASLLDQVLAETLDPAYAQAAQARQAREARRQAAVTAGRPSAAADAVQDRRADHRRGQLLVAATLAVAGLLAAVTYHEAAAGAPGRQQVREALIADIDNESATTVGLVDQLEILRTQVTAARDDALAATAIGQRALDELAAATVGAAAVPVTGPGLLVTLANADPGANGDPVGGSTAEEIAGRVQDGDLQLVVNALWASGAEAISIDDQRLGPTTAIGFAGDAVLVDFRPVTSPYEVRAIGDPELLSGRFLRSQEVAALALISENFGLLFEFAERDDLALAAGNTSELRFAVPAPRVVVPPAAVSTPGG